MQIQIVAQRQLLSNTYSCDSGSSLTTFLEFLSHTLVHMCILYLFWSNCPCRQVNWETRELGSFVSFTFLEPLMEVRLLLPTVPTPRQCSHQWVILVFPERLFQLGLHQTSLYLTHYFCGTFPASERLLLLTILCSNFLFSWTLYQTLLRKRDKSHSVYVTAHCTWNWTFGWVLFLGVDRNMYTEFNRIKMGTMPLFHVFFL